MSRHKSIQVLPEELVIDILSRLPFKSLTTCKCVSILWRKLSTSLTFKTFIRTHSSANNNNPSDEHHFLFGRQFRHVQELSLEWRLLSFDMYENYRTLGRCVSLPSFFSNFSNSTNICDGLVCFFNVWSLPYDLPISVYSLTIHDLVTLPMTSDKPFSWKHNVWCFLGFEPVKGEYAVLRTITSESLVSSYQVISIGSKSWKQIDGISVLSRGRPCRNTSGISVDGVIYWIHNSHISKDTEDCKILHVAAFDLGRQEFRVFNVDELVGCSYKNNHAYFLTSLKGFPTLFFWKSSFFDEEVVQWTLSDHANANCASWGRTLIPRSSITSHWFRGIRIYVGCSIVIQNAGEGDSRYVCHNYEDGTSWITTGQEL